jgi:hypothetical protein
MPKSHDDPDEIDPIDFSHMAREAKERAARRKHSAYESSEPPPIPSSYPTAIQGIGSPSPYRGRTATPVGFGTGVAHIAHASGHIGKRLAVLLAAWGSVSWVGAVALTYWTSHSVVSLDRYAKDEAAKTIEQNTRNRDVASLRDAINDLREELAAHQAALNVMQQLPIQPEKKKKPR